MSDDAIAYSEISFFLPENLTIAQTLAIAILKGDDTAIYPLLDCLQEQIQRPEGHMDYKELVSRLVMLEAKTSSPTQHVGSYVTVESYNVLSGARISGSARVIGYTTDGCRIVVNDASGLVSIVSG